jgi:nicotinate dehydrogenase subunit B
MTAGKLPGPVSVTPRLNRWLRFNADRTVTLCTGRVEIGQGVLTALAQMAAEELEIPFDRMRVDAASTKGSPNEGHTSGSRSIDDGGAAVRHVSAEVRRVLLAAAAEKLDLPPDALTVDAGTITGGDRIRQVSYWELPTAELLDRDATPSVTPRSHASHKVVGRSAARLDIPDKIKGAPRYVHDMQLPQMVHGRVVRPASYEATLEAFDAAAVSALPGVLAVVRDGRFIGVIAEREEQAVKAREGAQKAATWKTQATLPAGDALAPFLKENAAPAAIVAEKRAAEGLPKTAQRVSARYWRPYLAHASIGPSCAVARWSADRTSVELWTHTQGVYPLRDELARLLDLPAERVTVTHVEGPGCFGHNGADDAAYDAVLLARAVAPRPLKLQWMRDDEFAWEPFGPAATMEIDAAVDENGSIVDWNFDVWSNPHSGRPGGKSTRRVSALAAAWHFAEPYERTPLTDPPLAGGGGTERNAIPLYDFANQRITKHLVHATPLRTSTLRALGAYGNIFALESFMDELAARAGADPAEYRLRHMRDPRARAVIELAAKKADWKAGAVSDGATGRGFAFGQYKNGYGHIAMVCDVDVEREPRVTRVVCAVDVGQIINPDGVINQIEGGIIQSISWTLKEEVTFDRERVTSLDWESYPILTFDDVPEIETHLISHPDKPPLGAGEVPAGPTAAAIANAVFHALGVRVRSLPLTRQRIIEAMDGK